MTPQMQQETQQMQQQQQQQQMPPTPWPTICTQEGVLKLGQKEANAVAEYFREVLNIHVASRSRTRTLPVMREDLARKWPKDLTSVTVPVLR